MQICGEANILVFREAAAAGLQRAAFVSVHDYNVPGVQSQACRAPPKQAGRADQAHSSAYAPERTGSSESSWHHLQHLRLRSMLHSASHACKSTWESQGMQTLTPAAHCCACCADFFFKGYFQGKRNAEAALAQSFPEGGVAVRPSFVHGTRQVGSVGIPLGAIGKPFAGVYTREAMQSRPAACRMLAWCKPWLC